MNAKKLPESVERWLIHASYRFYKLNNKEHHFTLIVTHTDAFNSVIEIFCPRQPTLALVIGILIPLKNNQNARYLSLNDAQKQSFEKKVTEYCTSIKAICRTRTENGRFIVGIYAVLDDKKSFNQLDFGNAMSEVIKMGDQVRRYIFKTF